MKKPWTRGGPSPNPKGRPKGSKNRVSQRMLKALADANLKKVASTPLDYMLAVLVDPRSSKCDKKWAAVSAAPYVHKRMPIAIEDDRTPLVPPSIHVHFVEPKKEETSHPPMVKG